MLFFLCTLVPLFHFNTGVAFNASEFGPFVLLDRDLLRADFRACKRARLASLCFTSRACLASAFDLRSARTWSDLVTKEALLFLISFCWAMSFFTPPPKLPLRFRRNLCCSTSNAAAPPLWPPLFLGPPLFWRPPLFLGPPFFLRPPPLDNVGFASIRCFAKTCCATVGLN